MIRKLCAEDINEVVSIWYSASVKAHDFIAEEFWHSQKEPMRDVYIPNSETWVYHLEDRISGFISYYQGFIPALFVSPSDQSNGIGTELLTTLKQHYNQLSLTVYAENTQAHSFYIRQGFIELERKLCEHTGHEEILMSWAL